METVAHAVPPHRLLHAELNGETLLHVPVELYKGLLRVVRDRGVVLQVVLRPGRLGLRAEVDLLLLFFGHGRVHSAGGDGTLYAQRCGFFSSAFHSQTRAGPSHAVVPYVSATSTAFGCLVENLSHAAINYLDPKVPGGGQA